MPRMIVVRRCSFLCLLPDLCITIRPNLSYEHTLQVHLSPYASHW
jgi:hypothetical protein